MKRFDVTLNFGKQGSYGCIISAKDKMEAIKVAAQWAKGCGWTGSHKKAVVIEKQGGV